MRKLLILIVAVILLLAACAPVYDGPVYSFRGHKRGDTLEDVIEKEGIEPFNETPMGVEFEIDDFYGYESEMSCKFENDSLIRISMFTLLTAKDGTQEDVFDEMVQNLTELFGEPLKIEDGEKRLTAVWEDKNLYVHFSVSPTAFHLHVALRFKG